MASERMFILDGRTVTTSVPAAATDLLARGFREITPDVQPDPEPEPMAAEAEPEPAESAVPKERSRRRGKDDLPGEPAEL